jgi:predicted esterase
MDTSGTPRGTAFISRPRTGSIWAARAIRLALAVALICGGCGRRSKQSAPHVAIRPFNFQIASGADHYQIEGFIARAAAPGRLPGLLVLNGDKGDARQCIRNTLIFTSMDIQVACISLPGYGKSSGPSRFVGPPSVQAARHALDLMAARADIDPARLAVWGLSDGAVAAGLLMDSDSRPRALILQSGAYDMIKLWPETTLEAKLGILRQVWPSKRALKERSVVEHLPRKLNCSVLILHGDRDRKSPIKQAEQLAEALTARGARVQTRYFHKGAHELGARVDGPLRDFLRENLIAPPKAPTPNTSGSPQSSAKAGPSAPGHD